MKNKIVSVIVPTKNSEATIGRCLDSINSQTYKEIEVIVIDNNSTDRTKDIARKYTKLIFNKGPERSAQRNFGASKAKGEFVLFIDSDMELTKNVVKECLEVWSEEKGKVGGIIIPEKSFGQGFWTRCKALERSFYLSVDWMEAPRFFSKKIFNKFKYDESQTGTEDFDLPQRIKSVLGSETIKRIHSFINHNEGKLLLSYTLKKKFYYAKTAKMYANKKYNKTFFNKQSSPIERYKLYFDNPKKLFNDPLVGFGMLFMKTAEFAAGALGFLSSRYLVFFRNK